LNLCNVITETAVEPEDVGIILVKVGMPSSSKYSFNVSRQFDLRTDTRDLDEELPTETREQIQNNF